MLLISIHHIHLVRRWCFKKSKKWSFNNDWLNYLPPEMKSEVSRCLLQVFLLVQETFGQSLLVTVSQQVLPYPTFFFFLTHSLLTSGEANWLTTGPNFFLDKNCFFFSICKDNYYAYLKNIFKKISFWETVNEQQWLIVTDKIQSIISHVIR